MQRNGYYRGMLMSVVLCTAAWVMLKSETYTFLSSTDATIMTTRIYQDRRSRYNREIPLFFHSYIKK